VSAEALREAAAKMRERAELAMDGPWESRVLGDGRAWVASKDDALSMHGYPATAEHIASWHPAVALAVADWLEDTATANERVGVMFASVLNGRNALNQKALAVAHAYLGSDA